MIPTCHLINVILVFGLFSSVYGENTTKTIELNKTLTSKNRELYGGYITIDPLSLLQINLENVNTNVTFIIIQVHSHLYDITLYNNTMVYGSYVTGTNVGLYSPIKPTLDTYYIVNNNDVELKLLISIHGYRKIDPIPGGCNMEFPVYIAPFMKVTYTKDMISVDAAAVAGPNHNCQVDQFPVNFYMMYLPEQNFDEDVYFEGIRNMLTLDNIEKNGVLMTGTFRMRRMLAAYPGTGVVFVAVAALNISSPTIKRDEYSIYVPIYSYACSPFEEGGCEILGGHLSRIVCASLLFVGLFLCFYGHRFFTIEMFLVGMITGFLVSYIVISLIADLESEPLVAASFISGIFFGAIWITFWWFYGIPIIAVMLSTLNLGFLVAAILYYHLPTGDLIQIDLYYWTVFLLTILLVSLVLLSAAILSNIMCCVVLGAYAAVYPIDMYLGSSLKFIVINVVRRALVPKFRFALLAPPFQWKDGIVTFIWVALAVCGLIFQHIQNRGKPPFPPPPRSITRGPELPVYRAIETESQNRREARRSPYECSDERTALLS